MMQVFTSGEDELISKNMVRTTICPSISISISISIPIFLFVFQLKFLNANFKVPKPSCRRRRCQRIIDNDVDTFAFCYTLTPLQPHPHIFIISPYSVSLSFIFTIILHTLSSRHILTNNISASLFCPGEFFTVLQQHVCWMFMETNECVYSLWRVKFSLPVVFPFE